MTSFVSSFGGSTKDGWLDVQAIKVRVKNNSQFFESRKWLEAHSSNSDREKKKKTEEQVCGENEEFYSACVTFDILTRHLNREVK